eukprot:6486574-Amphidinium_carterae.1
MSTDLYKYLAALAKSQLESVRDWLQALATNRPPKILSQASPWLTECWIGMPWFFKTSYKQPAEKEGEEEKIITIRGVRAIQKAWEGIKDKPTSELVVSQLDALAVFGAWLPSGASMALSKMKGALVKEKAATQPKQKEEDKKKRGKPSVGTRRHWRLLRHSCARRQRKLPRWAFACTHCYGSLWGSRPDFVYLWPLTEHKMGGSR